MAPIKRFPCASCGTRFKSPSDLSKHLCSGPKIQSVEREVRRCEHCQREFKYARDATRHRTECRKKKLTNYANDLRGCVDEENDVVIDERPRCTACGRQCRNKFELTRHKAEKHLEFDDVITCYLCDQNFGNYGMLKDHSFRCRERKAPDQKISTVQKPTRKANDPMRGLRRSNRDRFICEYCETRFSSRRALNQHQYLSDGITSADEEERLRNCRFWQSCVGNIGPDENIHVRLDELATAVAIFGEKCRDIPVHMCISCRCLFPRKILTGNPRTRVRYGENSRARAEVGLPPDGRLCDLCLKDVRAGTSPSVMWSNNLEIDFPPLQIQDLKPLELKFIAQVTPMVDIIMLGKMENYGFRGVVRTYISNLQESCRRQNLPTFGSDQIIVNFGGDRLKTVRVPEVRDALGWLSSHNPFYQHINPKLNIAASVEGEDDFHEEWFESEMMFPIEPMAEMPDATNPSLNLDPISCLQMDPLQNSWSLYQDPLIEYKAFPELFPLARGGWGEDREEELSFQNYIRSKIMNECDIFRLCPKYLAWLKTEKDVRTLKGVASLLLVQKRTQAGTVVSRTDLTEAKQMAKEQKLRRERLRSGCPGDTRGLEQLATDTSRSMLHWFGCTAEIPGTPSFWYQELMKLHARIATVGPPRIFLTFSVDSFGWEELDALRATCRLGRFANVRSWIREDPVPSTRHCHKRFQGLLSLIQTGKPLGKIKHWYFRYEVQGRGALHTHGVLWLEDNSIFDCKTPEEQQRLCDYLNTIICGRRDPSFPEDLNDLIHRLQLHGCVDKCYNKSYKTKKCGFPREVAEESHLNPDFLEGKNCRRIFIPKRTEGDIGYNDFNCPLLLYWRANLDIQVMVNPYAIMRYLAGYISKPESDALHNAARDVRMLRYTEGQKLGLAEMLSVYSVLMTYKETSSAEMVMRDIGAPLVLTNLHVDVMNLRFPQFTFRRLRPKAFTGDVGTEDKELQKEVDKRSDTILFDGKMERYRKRPTALEEICAYDFFKNYTIFLVRPGIKEQLVDPWLSTDGSFYVRRTENVKAIRLELGYPNTQEYYFGLLSAFVPFRDQHEFLTARNANYRDVLKTCIERRRVIEERLRTLSHHQYILNAISKLQLQDHYETLYAAVRDGRDMQMRLETPNLTFDPEDYDWLETMDSQRHQKRFPHPGETVQDSYLDNFGGPELEGLSTPYNFDEAAALLERVKGYTYSQLLAFKYVAMCVKSGKRIKLCILGMGPLLARSSEYIDSILGDAGVGKTALMKDLIMYYRLMTSGLLVHNTAVCMAYTANAALQIGGRTIHSTLGILPQTMGRGNANVVRPPSPVVIQALQRLFSDVTCVFVDEISMIPSRLFFHMNRRISLAKGSGDPNEFMGNIDVILCGDLSQLRPIHGDPIYTSPLFHKFDFIELRENVRQQADPPWSRLLYRFRNNNLWPRDIRKLQARIKGSANKFKRLKVEQFLYPTNKEADKQNEYCVSRLPGPLIRIDAIDSVVDASHRTQPIEETNFVISRRLTGQLRPRLCLKVNARVALTKNISATLPNGAVGVIEAINYSTEVDQHGQRLVSSIDIRPSDKKIAEANPCGYREGCVRIERMRSEFYSGQMMERRQFPICLSFASTIHRAQGMTLGSVAVDLSTVFAKGTQELDRSLGYVALSRVIRRKDLHFRLRIQEEYLRVDPRPGQWMRKMKWHFDQFRQRIESLEDTDVREQVLVRFGLDREDAVEKSQECRVIQENDYVAI